MGSGMIRLHILARLAAGPLAAILLSLPSLASPAPPKDPDVLLIEPERGGGPHASKDLSGAIETRENLTLRLLTDLGSVRIVPLERGAPPVVRYSVHLETDARGSAAAQLLDRYALAAKGSPAGVEITGNLPPVPRGAGAQFWVHFEVYVPASYSLDVASGAGDIQTFDVGGSATLSTEGGNIVGGRIGTNFSRLARSAATQLVAKLQTQGGHIQVEDVAGDLTAFTAGGHINTGYIFGEANLRSGGGHIRAAGIGGKADLSTEGGNITVGKAAKFVAVKTGGGQIDFGEVRGSVRAQTGGGGIRVMYVAGPMDVESSGGSICLTRVSGAVRAATDSGTITAWINPDSLDKRRSWVNLAGASQLTSGDGDIVVFLPRNLAANIEAIVENGGPRRIEADPALALQVAAKASSGMVKAFASLNGGGPVLRLKTAGGKIKLQYLESETALWDAMMRDQKARMARDLALAAMPEVRDRPATGVIAPPAEAEWPARPEAPDVWPGSLLDRLEERILGGVREDGDEFQKRIVKAPRPAYPEIARKAGIEGLVRLQVRLTGDGKIEVQKLLEGEPVLADAAMAAVKQWRGKPVWMDGRPVNVISTVSFRFQLR